jgi:hypothetical protein
VIIRIESRPGIAARDRDCGEPQPVLATVRVGGRTRTIRLLGAIEIAQVQADKTKRVPSLGVARAASYCLFESRSGPPRFSPSGGAHSCLARPGGRQGSARCGFVIGGQCFLVAVRQLESVAQLEVCGRVVCLQPPRKLGSLGPCGGQIADDAQDANEKPSRLNVLRFIADALAQEQNGFLFSVHADESLRPLHRARRLAVGRQNDGQPKHGMPPCSHREAQEHGTT